MIQLTFSLFSLSLSLFPSLSLPFSLFLSLSLSFSGAKNDNGWGMVTTGSDERDKAELKRLLKHGGQMATAVYIVADHASSGSSVELQIANGKCR